MMQFHEAGYVVADPRVRPASELGARRPADLPDAIDVLIVGSGPAGMLLAAQMAEFPSVCTRLVERRGGRLEIGQADGIQARSVETFQAFGFAEQIMQEAYEITAMNFWAPDPQNPADIVRTQRTADATDQFSEFPHLIVNQARVLDYFAQAAVNAPGKIVPDYGWEFATLSVTDEPDYPVQVTLRRTAGPETGSERVVRARYVVGCDGARSKVRKAIGRRLEGEQDMQAWAVLDVLAVTDFPDVRTKCAIQSESGSILLIPREGGYLVRWYVDLGTLTPETEGLVRETTFEEALATANRILHPYTLDVKHVEWYTVYEVAHRVTDKFDDVPFGAETTQVPRVFIAGDSCHTHSAKAGQGMNVSMQDTFNLGWKLGSVLTGRSPASLLATYSAERQQIAQDLIDFDREWAAMMAKKPEEFDHPDALGEFYLKTFEFPTGFMTQYQPSIIIGADAHQDLAADFPLGKRFRSFEVMRVADVNTIHLGHHARADGRWRIYVFADADGARLASWASWWGNDGSSPLNRHTPAGADRDAIFDVKVIYQQQHDDVDLGAVPDEFLPRRAPFDLIDYEKVYAALPDQDVFALRGVSRDGCVIVVRPDQYVAHILPLGETAALSAFFARNMIEQ